MAAMSEAKKKANKKWNDANLKDRYDRIQLVVPRGQKDIIQEHAKKHGVSLSAYILTSVNEAMERDIQANPKSPDVAIIEHSQAGDDEDLKLPWQE